MKFVILPIIVFMTVMVFASFKKHERKTNAPSLTTREWKGSYSTDNGPLVNEILFDFVKGQLIQVVDGL
jgi:hypothetical protein